MKEKLIEKGKMKHPKAEAVVTDSFVVEYRKYTTELTKKFLERKPWTPPDERKVLAFIPGTISAIFVKEGQHVEEGEEMMILEAMKMKNKIYASSTGTIAKIHVVEGEHVSKSKVVLEMK